ncbi:D-tyrosyl-tRNA(Tyr) deacylase [Bacteroidetes/Chlorobi group bacterium MS-B_bin-24]|nr:MAG: D-tyrosyl-tRNA(Tyr) deacylase [Bacteroidetes/Chlorobi group bacterium MS-B_bin-24]
MRAVIQRVKKATVKILSTKEERSIGNGLLVFLAIKTDDTMEMIKWFANKIVNLRIFPDSENKMNLSVRDINGEIMVISNFTLYGDVSRGFRPNFMFSANPELAKNLYQQFVEYLRNNYPIPIVSGDFGEMMNIELVNDGPVTIIIDK